MRSKTALAKKNNKTPIALPDVGHLGGQDGIDLRGTVHLVLVVPPVLTGDHLAAMVGAIRPTAWVDVALHRAVRPHVVPLETALHLVAPGAVHLGGLRTARHPAAGHPATPRPAAPHRGTHGAVARLLAADHPHEGHHVTTHPLDADRPHVVMRGDVAPLLGDARHLGTRGDATNRRPVAPLLGDNSPRIDAGHHRGMGLLLGAEAETSLLEMYVYTVEFVYGDVCLTGQFFFSESV